MPWVPDEFLKLYRDLNASMVTVVQGIQNIERHTRRLERRMDEMAKSNQAIIDEVRQIRGFVASLKAAFDGLQQRITDLLKDGEVDDAVVAEVDTAFNEAKDAAAAIGQAVVTNPTPADPVPPPLPPGA